MWRLDTGSNKNFIVHTSRSFEWGPRSECGAAINLGTTRDVRIINI